ncbi:Ras-like protein 5 [Sarcoptes scabiei]|uniref:Ras-like protein 5 n=1 Tax=Sarcoptes scabiei TaxID=52283 RepID=A0A131ZZJ0_SARSC|nr:Ras-like protein 5 [Sarcoptes scabiei]
MDSKTNDFEFKICLLGDSGVGKSSIVQRFVHNTFTSCNENTIGASFVTKTLFIQNEKYKLNIWDTAGQERYKALTPMYYRGANICIIVYDVTLRKSFESVKTWIQELKNYLFEKCLICVVGNKLDLVDRRAISLNEAKECADSVDAYFMETSAKDSHNINELFLNSKKIFKVSSDDVQH